MNNRRVWIGVAVVLLVLILAGGAYGLFLRPKPVPTPTPIPEIIVPTLSPFGAISGRVTESDGATPISGAEVFAAKTKEEYGSATTAADGTYTISNLTEGFYEVSVTALGFVETSRPGVRVIAGQTTTDIDFALSPGGGSISGKVAENDGVTPISGIEIWAIAEATGGFAVSNADGTFLISDLDSGVYEVSVSPTEYLPQSLLGIKVEAGKTTMGVNFALTKGGSISGTVDESDGITPIAEADIFAFGEKGGLGSATTAENGTYAIMGLAPDTYEVSVTAAGFAESLQLGVSVAAGQSVTNIDFSLGEFGSISGKVTKADGMTPIDEVKIHASEPAGGFGTAITGADGTYAIEELPLGSYEVEATKEGFSFAAKKLDSGEFFRSGV